MREMLKFYFDPLFEALDFYKQMLKYGNYDPDRYFRPKTVITASEALEKSKPLYNANRREFEKENITYITKKIGKAICNGEISINVHTDLINQTITQHFERLGYSINHQRKVCKDHAFCFGWNIEISWGKQ
jgi:hypothetical protein